jgi:hypothetical protein
MTEPTLTRCVVRMMDSPWFRYGALMIPQYLLILAVRADMLFRCVPAFVERSSGIPLMMAGDRVREQDAPVHENVRNVMEQLTGQKGCYSPVAFSTGDQS